MHYALAPSKRQVWRRPPRARSLIDFARDLRFGEGEVKGNRYVPESDPAQCEILKAMEQYREVKVLKPAQAGGTWASQIVPLLWVLFELQESAVYGGPDMQLLGKIWRQKIKTAIEESPWASRIPDSGKGSRGGAPDEIIFTNGAALTFIGAGAKNEAAQAAVTARAAFTDEYDSIEDYRRTLIKSRTKSYGDRALHSDNSTLKEALGDSLLLSEYEHLSTRSRLAFLCPHTGRYRVLEKDQLRFDNSSPAAAKATARLVFEDDNGATVEWSEHDRARALRDSVIVHKGQWIVSCLDSDGAVCESRVVGAAPDTDVFGIRWTCLDTRIGRTLGSVAAEWVRADQLAEKGKEYALANLFRDEFVEPYISQQAVSEGLVPATVAERVTEHERGVVPPDTIGITIGTDPGGARTGIHWVAMAWRPNRRGHLFAYGRFAPIATDGTAVLMALQAWHSDSVAPGWAGHHVTFGFVDSNWETEAIDTFCSGLGFDRWKPTQGYSDTQYGAKTYHPKKSTESKKVLKHDRSREIPTWHEERLEKRGRLVRFNANYWKGYVHQGLRSPTTHPGAITLHAGDAEMHMQSGDIENARQVPGIAVQLCAERQVYDEGKGVYVWKIAQDIARENHWLDAAANACAAADYAGYLREEQPAARKAGSSSTKNTQAIRTRDGRPYLISQRN